MSSGSEVGANEGVEVYAVAGKRSHNEANSQGSSMPYCSPYAPCLGKAGKECTYTNHCKRKYVDKNENLFEYKSTYECIKEQEDKVKALIIREKKQKQFG